MALFLSSKCIFAQNNDDRVKLEIAMERRSAILRPFSSEPGQLSTLARLGLQSATGFLGRYDCLALKRGLTGEV
jgi:hypothetical protein